MSRPMTALALGFLAAIAGLAAAPPGGPVIETGDIDRFYKIYDASGGHPSADQLQHDYLDQGSEGLRHLAKVRNVTGARIAANIAAHPEVYADARSCVAVLPRVRTRVSAALTKLGELYPAAKFPPVTIVIGRGKPLAIGSPASGVQIGLEAACSARMVDPDVPDAEELFVHMIPHEFAHVQQAASMVDDERPTVLEVALVEGGAELVAELTSGAVSYTHLRKFTTGRELQIETAFVPDEDKRDLSHWAYNHPGTADWPADLAYWVGYRIVKSYYEHAPDKRRALAEILEMTDPHALLAKSGWRPGMKL